MTEIKFDSRNYRKHGEKNKKLIAKSLKECGAGRSIVIDADGEIIAGNGIYEAAQKAKIPVREVETDGTELVVVRRTDLHTEDEKFGVRSGAFTGRFRHRRAKRFRC